MNAQTHKATPSFPLGYHYQTEIDAIAKAKMYSLVYEDHYIYVFFSTSNGRYRHDYIGLRYSDERLICVINNGEKTL